MEVCRGGVSGRCDGVGRGGGWSGWDACMGRALGAQGRVWGVCVCAWACVGRACFAISVGIARSALLSGYLGKSGHLPR